MHYPEPLSRFLLRSSAPDGFMWSWGKQGHSEEQVPVCTYCGCWKNLKDIKGTEGRGVRWRWGKSKPKGYYDYDLQKKVIVNFIVFFNQQDKLQCPNMVGVKKESKITSCSSRTILVLWQSVISDEKFKTSSFALHRWSCVWAGSQIRTFERGHISQGCCQVCSLFCFASHVFLTARWRDILNQWAGLRNWHLW